jgi:DNA-directed RNA polymerase subunit RPC12/RpoP
MSFEYEAKCGNCGAVIGVLTFDVKLTEAEQVRRCEACYLCITCATPVETGDQIDEGGGG